MSPNVDDLKRSRFLTQHEVDPARLVTISSYEQMNVARQRAEPDMRYVLYFKELDKPMTLNKTNGQLIAAIIGSDEFDDWVGHKIVLYKDPTVDFGGELVGGIRCRAPSKAYMAAQDTSAEDKAAQEVIDSVGDDIPASPALPLQNNPKKYRGQDRGQDKPPF